LNDLTKHVPQGEALALGKIVTGNGLLKRLQESNRKKSFVLGQFSGEMACWDDPGHVCVIAGPRSDKGAAMAGTLLVTERSLFHFTTKSSDAQRIAPRRGKGIEELCDGLGQKVAVLDCYNRTQGVEELKHAIDPIGHFMKPEHPDFVARGRRVAECLLPNEAGQKRDYFEMDARGTGSLLAMFVADDPRFEGNRNLMQVYHLAQVGDEELQEALIESGEMPMKEDGTPKYDAFEVMFGRMMENKNHGGVIARGGKALRDMRRGASKQWLGVQRSLVVALEFLDDPAMQILFGVGDLPVLDFSEYKHNPNGVSTLMCMEEGKIDTAGAAVTLAYMMLEEELRQPGKNAEDRGVVVYLDEFGALPRMKTILSSMASIAGYGSGVTLVLMSQSLAQIRQRYGEDGLNTIMSGCTVKIFFDIRDLFTAEYIMKLGGDKEVIAVNRTLSHTEGESQAATEGTADQVGEGEQSGWGFGSGIHTSVAESLGIGKGHGYEGSVWNSITPLLWRKGWHTNQNVNLTNTNTNGFNRNSNISGGRNTNHSHTKNRSKTATTNQSNTLALAEQHQARPLLPVNEVMNNYSINNENGRLALVNISGIGFFEISRVRYWEHSFYYRKFGADSDFKFQQAPNPNQAIRLTEKLTALVKQRMEREGNAGWLKAGGMAVGVAGVLTGGIVPAVAGLLSIPIINGIRDGIEKGNAEIEELAQQAEEANWSFTEE